MSKKRQTNERESWNNGTTSLTFKKSLLLSTPSIKGLNNSIAPTLLTKYRPKDYSKISSKHSRTNIKNALPTPNPQTSKTNPKPFAMYPSHHLVLLGSQQIPKQGRRRLPQLHEVIVLLPKSKKHPQNIQLPPQLSTHARTRRKRSSHAVSKEKRIKIRSRITNQTPQP